METTPVELPVEVPAEVRVEASFQLHTDERLLGLLTSEEDRLSRHAVDEIVSRGARMIQPLSEICHDAEAWNCVGAESWAPAHATFILGAMESERALGALLDSMHESVSRNRSIVWKAIPAILGALGRPAVPSLKKRVRDVDVSNREKTVAIHALASVAARHAVEQGDAGFALPEPPADRREHQDVVQRT